MNHPDIFTICANQADFGGTDLVIDARAGVSLWRRVVRSAGYWFIPLVMAEFRGWNLDCGAERFKRDHQGYSSKSSHISKVWRQHAHVAED